jgi:SsrA-binding protein
MAGIKIITKNKRASYDFALSDTFEAGMALKGTEVKSLRAGKVKINESYISVDKKGEVWIHNMMISHYEFGTYANHDETRKRKLLLNRKEIEELDRGIKQKGLTIVPTKLYFKGSLVKIEIALAKGKKLYDKREDKAKKDVERKLRQGKYD